MKWCEESEALAHDHSKKSILMDALTMDHGMVSKYLSLRGRTAPAPCIRKCFVQSRCAVSRQPPGLLQHQCPSIQPYWTVTCRVHMTHLSHDSLRTFVPTSTPSTSTIPCLIPSANLTINVSRSTPYANESNARICQTYTAAASTVSACHLRHLSPRRLLFIRHNLYICLPSSLQRGLSCVLLTLLRCRCGHRTWGADTAHQEAAECCRWRVCGSWSLWAQSLAVQQQIWKRERALLKSHQGEGGKRHI